ncbi:MAG: hypothetical protein QOE72_1476 [Chloroflexota bacterium]|jgi:hypothetical protein|nr:hypothetical protein [Chloroflexota bacterium]
MSVTVLALSFDCADPGLLARFWADVLGRQVNAGAKADFAAIGVDDAATSGPLLMFHQVPEGKTVKNRVHLDLVTSEMDVETGRLLGLGARRIRDVEKGSSRWTTFADPEGNEFDLVAG